MLAYVGVGFTDTIRLLRVGRGVTKWGVYGRACMRAVAKLFRVVVDVWDVAIVMMIAWLCGSFFSGRRQTLV